MKQKRLAGAKIIFLFGAVLIIVFLLLFHKEERLKAMLDLAQPDHISVLYLQLLVKLESCRLPGKSAAVLGY